MEKFSEKVNRDINFVKEVPIKFPIEVYNEFSKYAKENSGDCYWLAVKNLLAERKNNDKFDILASRIDALEDKIATMQATPAEEKKVFKSFGSG